MCCVKHHKNSFSLVRRIFFEQNNLVFIHSFSVYISFKRVCYDRIVYYYKHLRNFPQYKTRDQIFSESSFLIIFIPNWKGIRKFNETNTIPLITATHFEDKLLYKCVKILWSSDRVRDVRSCPLFETYLTSMHNGKTNSDQRKLISEVSQESRCTVYSLHLKIPSFEQKSG